MRNTTLGGSADFRTDVSPDSEEIEQTRTVRFYCETFRAWRKSKTNPPLPTTLKDFFGGLFCWVDSHALPYGNGFSPPNTYVKNQDFSITTFFQDIWSEVFHVIESL